jgi:hypothetical protein
MSYYNLKNILLQTFTVLLIFSMISFLSMTHYLNERYSLTYLNNNRKIRLNNVEKFAIKPNINRLNSLFDLMTIKEAYYQDILDRLNLISFKKLANGAGLNDEYYRKEIKEYLDLNGKVIKVNEKFIKYLNKKSEYFSFIWEKTTSKIDFQNISIGSTTQKPVFLTSANKKYYEPLKEIIKNIKHYFPNSFIYVYILNEINDNMIKDLDLLCEDQCKIIKFDSDDRYKSKSPHVSNLVTYSWKPLIIQAIFWLICKIEFYLINLLYMILKYRKF